MEWRHRGGGGPPLFLVMGPTASGKSALVMEWASTGVPIELICADAVTVYKGLDIGSAKPTLEDRRAVPHHLLDVCSPKETYTVARFLEAVQGVLPEIYARGRIPVLVGGTALYFKLWMEGLSPIPESEPNGRQALEERAREPNGVRALHRELEQVDPELAVRIAPQDRQRLVRALEVYYRTGVPLSRWQRETRREAPANSYTIESFIVTPEKRSDLDAPIVSRFWDLMKLGFEEEVRDLLSDGVDPNRAALRSVGYRQLVEGIFGKVERAHACRSAIQATRQLAKRQLTWFRHWPWPYTSLPMDDRQGAVRALRAAWAKWR